MTDLDVLTGSRAWSANPHDYNCLHLLTFSPDGHGQLVLGYGQAIFAEVDYWFELRSGGVLRLVFLDAPRVERFNENELGQRLVEAEHGNPRDLKYVLRTGDFMGVMNTNSIPFHFRAALMLDGPPYSEPTVRGLAPRPMLTTGYTYYGHSVPPGARIHTSDQ